MRFSLVFATLAAVSCTTQSGSSGLSPQAEEVEAVCTVNGPDPRACDPADTKKTTVCHIPPGNPNNAHTICVGNAAVPAHLGHGDFLGTCICTGSGSDGGGGSGGGGGGGGSGGGGGGSDVVP